MEALSPIVLFVLAACVLILVWGWLSRRFWGRDTQIREAKRTNQLLEALVKNQHAMREDQRTLLNHIAKNKTRK